MASFDTVVTRKDVEVGFNSSFRTYMTSNVAKKKLEVDIMNAFSELEKKYCREPEAAKDEHLEAEVPYPKRKQYVEFEFKDVANPDHGSVLPITLAKTTRKISLVPVQYQRAKRLPVPQLWGDYVSDYLRSFWEGKKVPKATMTSHLQGPFPAQWFERGTYYYVGELKREVSFSDLFFDLIFVVLISRGGERLSEALTYLAVARHFLLFFCLFETWHFASSMSNVLYAHSTMERIISFIFAVFAIWMGNFTFNAFTRDEALDTTTQFISVYLIAGLVRLAILIVTAIQIKPLRGSILWKSFVIVFFSIPWVVSSFMPGQLETQAILWGISSVCVIIFVWLLNGFNLFHGKIHATLNPGHWMERLHLFVLISFGEGVSKAVVNLNAAENWGHGFAASFLAITIFSIMTWTYFSCEGQSGTVLIHALRRSEFVGNVWTVAHFFIILSAVAIANGVGTLSALYMHDWHPDSPNGPQDGNDALLRVKWLVSMGMLIFLIGCTVISMLHVTIFDMPKALLRRQDEICSKSRVYIPRFFWERQFKVVRLIAQVLVAVLIQIPAIGGFRLSSLEYLGCIAGIFVFLALVEEYYSTVFGVAIELVEHIGEEHENRENDDRSFSFAE